MDSALFFKVCFIPEVQDEIFGAHNRDNNQHHSGHGSTEYLTKSNLVSTMTVCKTLFQIIRPFLWHSLDFRATVDGNDDTIEIRCPSESTLKKYAYWIREFSTSEPRHLKWLASSGLCTRLIELEVMELALIQTSVLGIHNVDGVVDGEVGMELPLEAEDVAHGVNWETGHEGENRAGQVDNDISNLNIADTDHGLKCESSFSSEHSSSTQSN